MQSGGPESENPMTQRVQSLSSSADTRGKHRVHAELKRIEQEARFLEEEMEQLEKVEKASTSCKESVGPVSPTWDRWFEGPKDSKGCCRCSIL